MMNKQPIGVLSTIDRPFQMQRIPATGKLANYLEYFWLVTWSIPQGQSFISENLPHPSVHVVYEPGNSGIFGPVKGLFRKELSGSGRVIGARVKAGLFHELYKKPVSSLTNQTLNFSEVFNISSEQLEQKLNGLTDINQAQIEFAKILSLEIEHRNLPCKKALQVHRILNDIEANRLLLTVEQLSAEYELSMRQLERPFQQYVGLTPKWVLRLYRLQQLADQVVSGDNFDWANLALKLGYFDQAHCIRDFKKMTGKTPSQYQ